MVNSTLIIFMIVAIVLLFATMIMSAIAADKAKKDPDSCQKDCHKYSMISAIMTGVSVGVMAIILIVYIYSSRKDIAEATQKQLLAAHAALGNIGVPTAVASSASMPSADQLMV